MPRLQRTIKHGVLSCNDVNLRNELVLTLAGTSIECTLQPDGTCKPHVESGFIRIKRDLNDGTQFKVTDKSGITYTFGGMGAVTTDWSLGATFGGENAVTGSTTADAFNANVTPCQYISMWALRKVEDPNGNYMEYRYVRDGGMLYPHSIVYGAHPSGPMQHQFTVYFLWQGRDTPVLNALGGYAAEMRYRLQRINVIFGSQPVSGELVRGYNFTYEAPWDNTPATRRRGREDFLESVTLLGDNGFALTNAHGESASTIFMYHPTGVGFESVAQNATRPALLDPPKGLRVREGSGWRRDVMDMNGDGFPDLVDAAIGVQCKPDSSAPNDRFWTVYFGSTSGFSTQPTRWYLPPTSSVPACIIRGVVNGESDANHTRFTTADMTGDGIPDLIDSQVQTYGVRFWLVYPGTAQSPHSPTGGWGFGSPIAWGFAAGEGAGRDYVGKTAYVEAEIGGFDGPVTVLYQDLLDINGDGRPDLVRTCGDNCEFSNNWEVYLNNGTNGFRPRESFTGKFKALTVTNGNPATLYTVADMNGDGLPDQVIGQWGQGPQRYEVCLNTGHAMACEDWPVPPRDLDVGTLVQEHYSAFQNTVRDLIDMNGDGLPDVVDRAGYHPVTNRNWRVFLNSGRGFEETVIPWPAPNGLIREGGDQGIITYDTFDLDGDDIVDHVDFYNNGGALYAIYHAANGAWTSTGTGVQPRLIGVRPDLLEVAENGVGAKTTLHYRPSTAWDNKGGDAVPDLPFNVWTVTQICHDDAAGFGTCDAPDAGHQVGMNIVYAFGRYDPVEREFRGFANVTTTTIANADPPPRGTLTIYHQRAALSGKVQQVLTYDGRGNFLTKPIAAMFNTWQCADPVSGNPLPLPNPADPLSGCPAHPAGEVWVRLKQVDEYTYQNFTFAFRRRSTVNETWHKCGTKSYGNVEDAYQGELSGSPQLHTHTEYACNETAYILDRPVRVVVKKSDNSTILEETWLQYDGAGNVTKIESLIDQGDLGLASTCAQQTGAKCATSTMVYDGRGLLTQVTDPNQQKTTTSYDATYLYPATVTQASDQPALALKTTAAYDPKCGGLLSKTIPYRGTTPASTDTWRYTYDHYCRLTMSHKSALDTGHVLWQKQ